MGLKALADLEFGTFGFDSYMVLEENLKFGQFRLLTVDVQALVPAETLVRAIVTSSDVLHS